jgi:GRIP and coiled-coil domain-containing protein 1
LNINFNFNEIWIQNGDMMTASKSINELEEKQTELTSQIDKLKEENRHLKEEYEKYKIRTNYLIKSAKQISTTTSEQEQQQSQQIKKLKDELENLKKILIINETKYNQDLNNLTILNEKQSNDLRLEFKHQLEKQENERYKVVNDLEKELIKQRERTVKLLDEKENELQQYREKNNVKFITKSNNISTDLSLNVSVEHVYDENNKSPQASPKHNNKILEANRLIYFSQETAYKDTELNKLRLAKSELEYKFKNSLDEHSVDIERLLSQINVLKQEIERLKLNQSRNEMNSSNLEYIKNVVFNYMTTKDANVKQSMQTAITQILHFTKSEKQRLTSASSVRSVISN